MLYCLFKLQNNFATKMKGVNCRNIERFVANRNRDVHKQLQGVTRSTLAIESIIGTNSQALKGSVVFALSAEEVIYYSSEYFIVHNLLTKENSTISKEGCSNHSTLYIDHFQTEINTGIIFTIEQSAAHLFLGQLQITGSITESNGTNSQSEMKNCNWRLSKLTNKCGYAIDHVCYHSSKQYLYLLASRVKEDRIQRCLWVYDLKRQCMIMSPEIKAGVGRAEISRIWVTEDPAEIYLMGVSYFRFWTVNFNEKTIRQSNYRNIERCLADKTVLSLFHNRSAEGGLLNIVTDTHILLLRRNELLSCEKPAINSLKKTKSKDNIEVELQNSLNQIYRMKFLFDQEEGEPKQMDQYQITPEQAEVDSDQFCCASGLWTGEAGECIMIATKGGNLLTFSVGGGQMKLLSELAARKPHRFDFITASRRGQVVLLSEKRCQQLYIINKYSLSSEESEEELKPFWGMGHVGKQTLLSIDSPAVHQRVCTLGQQSTLRLWSFKGRERRILFEEHLQHQPNQVTMHPCGLLVAINYAYEIKLMSLLPTGLYEVISVRTNYNSIGLRYSECGNYLVSNQQNLLVIYNPFTLKILGYLQPPQLKSSIVDFQISPEGSHIGFHTSDFSFYLLPLDLNASFKFQTLRPSHCQREQYTCFYFETGLPRNSRSPPQTVEENLFIGCTKNKYMALYRELGKELVIEFAVEDCYVTSLCVADGWLFAATSKGTIRVYRWPILEEECELEIANVEQKAVRLKHPIFDEYSFWNDGKRITKMHKLAFINKLLVARQGGILGIIRYDRSSGERIEQLGERKKLVQIVNETFFITKNESEKRNRLIEKTEGDILKVENEIAKEKSIMERKYREECNQIEKNYQEKTDINAEEKAEHLAKLTTEIRRLTQATTNKRNEVDRQTAATMGLYVNKLQYERKRNEEIERKTAEGISQHKLRISTQIQSHKQKIRGIKNEYRERIAGMRRQFESRISEDYPCLVSKSNIRQTSAKSHSRPATRVSWEVNQVPHRLSDFVQGQVLDDEINNLGSKVEEVTRSNVELKQILQQIKLKMRVAQGEDEELQKEFQRCLQDYNSSRFSNLSLHSQVLKMRTQLIERKQIMDNKQEIINLAFQERQKLENYKSLVKGSLGKLQDHKQHTHQLFVSKENELSLIFSELSSSFRALQELKREQRQTEGLVAVLSKEKELGDSRVELAVARLKQLKRYLLFEGLTEDAQQKRMYLQQQTLLTAINFYKKRMSMQFMKEKKNKLLKKSAVNLVLKQNKNLLEECNQLREETIDYEHEIKNLGGKLGEAHRIISIETKLKDQRGEVEQQRSQLEAIRTLFTNQMVSYTENGGYEGEAV